MDFSIYLQIFYLCYNLSRGCYKKYKPRSILQKSKEYKEEFLL